MTVTVGAHHCCFTGTIGDPIAKSLMPCLWQRVLHLLTGIQRTMKNSLLPLLDKLLLRKRSITRNSFCQRKVWKTPKRFHRKLSLLSYNKAFEKPGPSRKGCITFTSV